MSSLVIMMKPVSSICNMKCDYCFYNDLSQNREVKSYGIMTHETLDIIIRRAFGYADNYITFVFQGGEPTLAGIGFYQHFVNTVAKYNRRKLQISYSIQTNGFQLSQEFASFFKQHGFLVGVSLDGTKEIHDSYRKTINGERTYSSVLNTLDILNHFLVDVNILCVVTKAISMNPNEVFEALRPFKYLQFIPCIDKINGGKKDYSLSDVDYGHFLIELFDKYIETFHSKRTISVRNFDNYISILNGKVPEQCGMRGTCGQYFLIEADGSVYPCDFYVFDKWKLGNIRERSLFNLKDESDRFINTSKEIHPQCRECEYYVLCRGGCRRDRDIMLDDQLTLNRFCKSYKMLFSKKYSEMVKLAETIHN